ncbi:MAG: DNA repair protein RecN [Armatimonadetes bacterium]|nr:DNA repair protein RecN [Armatimonadota bacterium]MDE2207007.1 DNA repair protein RecN [Armatimonadota bacterium]
MLASLSIRQFAIIERLDVEFGPGLSVLTGETGAGKSIVIDALGLVLGEKADSAAVRDGADRATVDAVFDLSRAPATRAALLEMGFDLDEGTLLVSREVTTAGKSTARIAGRPVTNAQLREAGAVLVDLHGQHEHQSLLKTSAQLAFLDEWIGDAAQALKSQTSAIWRERAEAIAELERVAAAASARGSNLELARFQASEIREAGFTTTEAEALERDRERAVHAHRLAELAGTALMALSGDEQTPGCADTAALAAQALDAMMPLDASVSSLTDSVRAAQIALVEARHELVSYHERLEMDPERIAQIEARFDQLQQLRRKYGATVEDILAYAEAAEAQLSGAEDQTARMAELERRVEELNALMAEQCTHLSRVRSEGARRFEAAVMEELMGLSMAGVRFQAELHPSSPGANGADTVEFLISANPGEPARPLVRIASGGEISRVMLGIKCALARNEPMPSMVFDEVDAGIGGQTANAVAHRLSSLAESAQILCITHLAQIASRAGHHFAIVKTESGGRITTSLNPLDGEDRVVEIARMIGGAEQSAAALMHAREMLRTPSRSDDHTGMKGPA